MRGTRLVASLGLLLALGCASSTIDPIDRPPGQIDLRIVPNPIEAIPIADGRFEFPFDIIVSEVGGNDVTIDEVRADVLAFGDIRVARKLLTRGDLEEKGFQTTIRAGKSVRYEFHEEHDLPDERLLDSVRAEVTIKGTDAAGRPTTTRATVTVRRR